MGVSELATVVSVAGMLLTGFWAIYKHIQDKKQKAKSIDAAVQIAEIEGETSHSEILTRAQQAFADDLQIEATRLRDVTKQLEVSKLKDLETISQLSIAKLEAELTIRRKEAKIHEVEEEKEDLNDIIKIVETKKLTLEGDIMVLRSHVDRLESEVTRLTSMLKEIGYHGKDK